MKEYCIHVHVSDTVLFMYLHLLSFIFKVWEDIEREIKLQEFDKWVYCRERMNRHGNGVDNPWYPDHVREALGMEPQPGSASLSPKKEPELPDDLY